MFDFERSWLERARTRVITLERGWDRPSCRSCNGTGAAYCVDIGICQRCGGSGIEPDEDDPRCGECYTALVVSSAGDAHCPSCGAVDSFLDLGIDVGLHRLHQHASFALWAIETRTRLEFAALHEDLDAAFTRLEVQFLGGSQGVEIW
jgi:hypothetical protein